MPLRPTPQEHTTQSDPPRTHHSTRRRAKERTDGGQHSLLARINTLLRETPQEHTTLSDAEGKRVRMEVSVYHARGSKLEKYGSVHARAAGERNRNNYCSISWNPDMDFPLSVLKSLNYFELVPPRSAAD